MTDNKPQSVGTARLFDPGRGDFDPVRRDPLVERETNPRGVRRPGATEQDRMPVKDRPRVIEAERLHHKRRAAGRKTA